MTPPFALQVSLAAFVLALFALLIGRPGSFAWFLLFSMAALTEFLTEEDDGC